MPVEELAEAGGPRGWGHGDERGVAGGEVVGVGVIGMVGVVIVAHGGWGGGVVGSGRGGGWSAVVALGGVGVGRHGPVVIAVRRI